MATRRCPNGGQPGGWGNPSASPLSERSDGVTGSLIDQFGRRFRYLRLSITDVCNFRCEYCLPHGYQGGPRDFLSRAEILRLVHAFAELGIVKLRLTGGEPLVRRDFVDIVRDAAGVPGIERLVMTTNAYRLAGIARELRDAGLHGVNISVDSLDPVAFARITGSDRFAAVMAGVDTAVEAGLSVKLNAILLGGLNDGEIPDFVEFVRDRPISVRFIELMQTRGNEAYFAERHRRGTLVTDRLLAAGWMPLQRSAIAGPAQEYGHPDYAGRIGVIEPYSRDFCDGCNRLRVTATGGLRLCLFGTGSHDLRPLLQHDADRDELKAAIATALLGKGAAHDLVRGSCGDTPHLAMTGG
jgi:GTP 3',8-cyclase